MAKKGSLTVRIIGDEKSFTGALGKATKGAQGFASKLPGILGVAGAVGGAALAAGLFEAFERDTANDRLGAALNLDPNEIEAVGRISGEVWAEAFGESIGDVNTAVEGVISTLADFGDVGEEGVGRLTRKALTIADVFNLDVSEAIQAAGVLMNTGLVDDADEAFDTITRGMQEMPAALRGELLEASNEYSQFFDALGFDSEEAFGALVKGAEDGLYGIDKTGDAIKEFTIRATDMSTASTEAFETVGLDAKEMAAQLLEGGDTAKDAFDTIIEGILSIEDPVDRANTAIALFGTPLEDLSVNEIPEFLESLTGIENKLGDVEGATDRVADTAYDNLGTRWTEAWRGAQQVFLTFADDNVIPAVERIMDAFDEGGLEGAMEQVRVEWEKAWPAIQSWLDNTLTPALIEWGSGVGKQIGLAMLKGLSDAFTAGFSAPGNFVDRQIAKIPGLGWVDDPAPAPTSPRRTTSGTSGGNNLVMHDGGIVPGRPGQEVNATLEAGERVIPARDAGMSGISIGTLNVGSIEDARKMDKELRMMSLAASYG